ncbi:hypothetical protein HD806DRAFT_506942 [Xylariaceae sp. AK1471]|nr:hypothetical protein HD806DRAFT_506942 [Xylariaceae sp. AK1471]
MADSLCGPSNAFKGLARHIEQDRSHQQDRVAPGPQHPAQNFRSAPFNSSGLTGQFGAFQQQNAALPEVPPADLEHLYALSARPNRAAPQTWRVGPAPEYFYQQQQRAIAQNTDGNWVNDFQRMNFSDAQAHPLHNQHAQGPFMRQPDLLQSMRPGLASPHHPVFQPFQAAPVGMHPINHDLSSDFKPPQFLDAGFLGSNAQTDLEQEFEDAMNEWMVQNGPQAEMSSQSKLNAQHSDNLTAHIDTALDVASPEPAAHEMVKEDSAGAQEADTELARAAQQLVDSVADNDSDKFKNSAFLALMRRIASQQLTVQGNDLVEAPQPPTTETDSGSHVTGETLAATPTATNRPNQ